MLCFIIALVLGFMTMNISGLAEQQSKAELEKLQSHLKYQEEVFAPNVGEATAMISQIPDYQQENINLEVLNQDIGAVISQTKNQVVKDESWESKMYQEVIQALSDLQLAYNEKVKLTEKVGDSNETSQKLQECIAERDRLQNQVNMLQASGGGGANCEQFEKDLAEALEKLRQCNTENRALRQEIQKIRN